MPSICILPESHDVYVSWDGGMATISEIQQLREKVAEMRDRSLQDIYKATKGSPKYFICRMDYLSAIEIQSICRESNIKIELV